VVAAIDAPAEPPVLVEHSGGGPIGYAAIDARPDWVRQMIYVDSGPLVDSAINDRLPIVGRGDPVARMGGVR
jgi:pimeloyl-ACP methyl ester carboxylesterase